jgi:hypothetical protein
MADPEPVIRDASDGTAGVEPGSAPAAVPTGEPSTGPRRVLVTLYAIFALAATSRAIVQIATKFDEAPLAYLLSLFSGLVYIGATVGLTTTKPWSRPLAWASCGTELAGVLTIGIWSIVDPSAFPDDTVWSRFGSGYGYVPLILPMLGLTWLWFTRPSRLAGRAPTATDVTAEPSR